MEPALSPADFLEHSEHPSCSTSSRNPAHGATRTSDFSKSLFLAPYGWAHFNSISEWGFSFYLVFCFFWEKKKKNTSSFPISDFAVLLVRHRTRTVGFSSHNEPGCFMLCP